MSNETKTMIVDIAGAAAILFVFPLAMMLIS